MVSASSASMIGSQNGRMLIGCARWRNSRTRALREPLAVALIKDPGGRGTGGERGVGVRAVVAVPVIEEDRDVGPGPLMITDRERVLGVRPDRIADVLRRGLIVGDHRPELDQHRLGLVEVAAPDVQPGPEQPQMRMMMGRRIQLERAVDHGRGAVPFAERDQRFGGVAGQHRADRALQTKITSDVDAGERLVQRFVVLPGQMQGVGVVDREAQRGLGVAVRERTGLLELGQALGLLADGGQPGAEGVAGVGFHRSRAGLDGRLDRLPGDLDAAGMSPASIIRLPS